MGMKGLYYEKVFVSILNRYLESVSNIEVYPGRLQLKTIAITVTFLMTYQTVKNRVDILVKIPLRILSLDSRNLILEKLSGSDK